jgi:hypothetical protein
MRGELAESIENIFHHFVLKVQSCGTEDIAMGDGAQNEALTASNDERLLKEFAEILISKQ